MTLTMVTAKLQLLVESNAVLGIDLDKKAAHKCFPVTFAAALATIKKQSCHKMLLIIHSIHHHTNLSTEDHKETLIKIHC